MKKSVRIGILRSVLALLILGNMLFIFLMSETPGEQSGETSSQLTRAVAELVVRNFDEKTPQEQELIINRLHHPIRKLAHMLEFGSLGALILLLHLTWKGRLLMRYASSVSLTFLYACSDEWHQSMIADRGPSFADVLLDTGGALIACSLILILVWIRKRRRGKMSVKTTYYQIPVKGDCGGVRLAVASDLHDCAWSDAAALLREEKPDMILIPGDLTDDLGLRNPDNAGYGFLRACAEIAPTYYSLGNHELACYHKGNPWRHPVPRALDDEIRRRIAETGAVLLDNDCVHMGNFCICGLTSGINGRQNQPDREALARFADEDGIRILLCHHPEYFVPYIQSTNIDLTVCGHAHGGHWRFFGRGVYAPGQGLFPKYTSGVIDGRCVISRGIGNHTWIPRIANPTELVIVELQNHKEEKGE